MSANLVLVPIKQTILTIKKSYLLSLMYVLIFLSCSTTKVSKIVDKSFPPFPLGTPVYFLTQNDSIPPFIEEVGKFNHAEDNNWTWPYIKKKIINEALKQGANIIKIDEFYLGGKNTKLHAARVLGRYFRTSNDKAFNIYVDSSRKKEFSNCNCSYVYLFRNEGDQLFRTLFPIQAYFDGKLLGQIANRRYYKIRVDEPGQHLLSTNQSEKNKFGLYIEKNQIYYVSVTQSIGGTTGTGTGVMIEDKKFSVHEYIEGKLRFENVERNPSH